MSRRTFVPRSGVALATSGVARSTGGGCHLMAKDLISPPREQVSNHSLVYSLSEQIEDGVLSGSGRDRVVDIKRRKRKPRGPLLFAVALMAAGAAGFYGPDLISGRPSDLFASIISERVPVFRGDAFLGKQTLTGRASVTDGDTIEIQGERIRFNGVDAPEAAQTCGERNGKPYRCGSRAAAALADFLSEASPRSARSPAWATRATTIPLRSPT